MASKPVTSTPIEPLLNSATLTTDLEVGTANAITVNNGIYDAKAFPTGSGQTYLWDQLPTFLTNSPTCVIIWRCLCDAEHDQCARVAPDDANLSEPDHRTRRGCNR